MSTAIATEEIRIGQVAVRFLLEGQASGGSVAVFEFDVPAGAKVPAAHSHDGYEETIYGLDGVLTWTVNGEKTDVGPGQVLCIPRGAVHRFDNIYPEDTRMLAIVSPGIPCSPSPAPGIPPRLLHLRYLLQLVGRSPRIGVRGVGTGRFSLPEHRFRHGR